MFSIREVSASKRLKNRLREQVLDLKGYYTNIEVWRNGERIIYIPHFFNLVTNVGKNNLLDVYFSDGTQTAASAWSMGLIAAASFSAVAAADTMASHGGWTEFTTYTQSTRVAWGPGEPASQSISNGTACTFDIGAVGGGVSLAGIFICTNSTKGGTTGTLFSAGQFPSGNIPVSPDDQIKNNYGLSL